MPLNPLFIDWKRNFGELASTSPCGLTLLPLCNRDATLYTSSLLTSEVQLCQLLPHHGATGVTALLSCVLMGLARLGSHGSLASVAYRHMVERVGYSGEERKQQPAHRTPKRTWRREAHQRVVCVSLLVTDLRKQARQLENELDLKLVSFSKLCTSYSSSRDGGRRDT